MTRVLTALSALLFLALTLAACAENPNEHVQSNEFFRPAADPGSQEQEGAASDATSQQSRSEDQASEPGESSDGDAQQSGSGEAHTQNLPENLKGKRYYQPSEQGYEAEVSDRLKRWWGNRER